MSDRISVAVLGATGTVGQKFIRLLEGHPTFEVIEVVASERSAGKRYADAVAWKQETSIPAGVTDLVVKDLSAPLTSTILFSGLDSSVAGEAETNYAAAGHTVISNSSNHRMDAHVPLIIPEINPDHFELVKHQPGPGAIITNSNCSSMFLAMALAPIHRSFGVRQVQVSTMQAISGAGYPGVASMDILGNVVPFIKNEEEKMEEESAKILGTLAGDRVEPAPFVVSAQCNRVPVFDGHTETVSFKLDREAPIGEIKRVLREFRGMPQERRLPSAPTQPIVVSDAIDRPQPARDIWVENGMATIVGRLRPCPVLDYKMVILGHNTVRGAAGAAILNAEAYVSLGYLK
ncbi:MAG: aspartate-semialdehyde dehydrogenase [Spirochaetota bacterium]